MYLVMWLWVICISSGYLNVTNNLVVEEAMNKPNKTIHQEHFNWFYSLMTFEYVSGAFARFVLIPYINGKHNVEQITQFGIL